MEADSTLALPNIYLINIDEDGFSLKLNRTEGGVFAYNELTEQVLTL